MIASKELWILPPTSINFPYSDKRWTYIERQYGILGMMAYNVLDSKKLIGFMTFLHVTTPSLTLFVVLYLYIDPFPP